MPTNEEARAVLAELETLHAEGWCACQSSTLPARIENALRDTIAERDAAVREMNARELHHFETEQAIARVLALVGDIGPEARRILTDALDSSSKSAAVPGFDDGREAFPEGTKRLSYEVRMMLSSVASHGPAALTTTSDRNYTANLLARLRNALEAADARRQGPITDAQKHADDLAAYVDYCLGLPMYQNVISEFGQGAVEAFRMVKRTLADGLHPDVRAALEAARAAR